MERIEYVITDENGIHARPAGLLVAAAKEYTADIRIRLPGDGRYANAKKLFAVMGLGVQKGDVIWLEADGTDAAEAIQAMAETMRRAGL